MAGFPIVPTVAIFIGLLLIEYLIYDAYRQNRSKDQNSKQYNIHNHTTLLDSSNIPPMVNLPILPQPNIPESHHNTSRTDHNTLENFAPEATPASIIPQMPSSPPLPESGLPEGWTIEQWNYYGAQWLESRNVS